MEQTESKIKLIFFLFLLLFDTFYYDTTMKTDSKNRLNLSGFRKPIPALAGLIGSIEFPGEP